MKIILILSLLLVGCATTKSTTPQKLDHAGFQWGCLAGLLNASATIKTPEETQQIANWCEMVEKAFRRKNNIVEDNSEK